MVELVHAPNDPVSSLHWIEPSETEKVKPALVEAAFAAGLPVIDTEGGEVSTFQVKVSLPVLPAPSIASTVKVCEPSVSPE